VFSDFTYADLRRIYDRVSGGPDHCLTFSALADPAGAPPSYCLIRHDLDYSLESGVELARRERDWGYRSTYFVLLACDNHNALSGPGAKAVRDLADLGHEVGLHYDAQAMAERGGDMDAQLALELSILANLIGRPIRSIAMHNPSIQGADPFAGVDFAVNAYSKDIIDEGGYYSDSAGAWRDHATDAIGKGEVPERVQLLIHPFLWGDARGDRFARLGAWREGKQAGLGEAARQVEQIWAAHSGAREHDLREARRPADDMA